MRRSPRSARRAEAGRPAAAPRRAWERAATLLPGAVAALLYARGIANGFALDDRVDLLENRFVTGPLDVGGIFGSEYYGGWGHMASGHYRPLLVLTYKAVAAAFGLTPRPYHALNVLLFAAIVTLTVRLVASVAGDARTGVVAGLLLAVHPVASESVAAIAGLKELASALLGLLALHFYLLGRAARGFDAAGLGARHAAACAAALAAALLYKETALAFVPVALAVELLHPAAPSARGRSSLARRALGIWPLLLAVAAAVLARASVTGGLFRPSAIEAVDNPLVVLAAPFRRFAAAALLGRYLVLFVWPARLSSDYSLGSLPIPASLGDPWIVGSILLAGAVAAALVWALRRRARAIGLGLTAFAASYLLVSNAIVLLGTLMAERNFFLPAWGLAVALAGVLVAAHDRAPLRGAARWSVPALAILVLVVPLAARTWVRLGDWKSNDTLADAVHRCYPGNVKVLVVLAEREARAGRHDGARSLYEKALSFGPDASYAQAATGVYLLDRGETERAVALLESSASGRTPVPGASLRLALSYLDRGRVDDAFRLATVALGAGPSFGDAAIAHVVRGEVFLRRSDAAAAAEEYRLAIRESPGEPVAHFDLGRVLEAEGRLEEALEELARADALAPGDSRILYARAVVEEKLGRLDRARATVDRLLAVDPSFPPAVELRSRLARTR